MAGSQVFRAAWVHDDRNRGHAGRRPDRGVGIVVMSLVPLAALAACTFACIGTGLALCAAFIFTERRVADPLFNLVVLRSPGLGAGLTFAPCAGGIRAVRVLLTATAVAIPSGAGVATGAFLARTVSAASR